ncbi:MAG TPA: 50S ribosomal protein L9 [bacterium]|nr:50S ribosomal protein L9 [bacterium]
MEVILLKDIKALGRSGEVKNVSDGYAINFLIPQHLATVATEEKLLVLRSQKIKTEKLSQERLTKEQELAVRLENLHLEIQAKASASGTLFAGIGPEEITQALKAQRQLFVEPRQIKLKKHLKETGNYQVLISLGKIQVRIIVKIISLE